MQVNSAGLQGEYLTLLISQLRNQDPLEPVSQQEFIAQLTQVSTLAGIEKLNGSFERMVSIQQDALRLEELASGAKLVGREVLYQDPLEGTSKAGIVESLDVFEDRLMLSVNGASVAVPDLLAVR